MDGRDRRPDRPPSTAEITDPTGRRAVLKAGAAALAAAAGCLGDGGGDGDDTVEMTSDNEYDPATLRVEAGTTVTWETTGNVDHTVTAYEDEIPDAAAYFASGGFDSEGAARSNISGGLIAEGETFEHAFEVAGTYEYFCVPHEGSGMTGTIRVE